MSHRLPDRARRILTPARRTLAVALLRFAVVGVAGLIVDIAAVYAWRNMVGVYVAGLLAFPVAATATWALNRAWTFRGAHAGSRVGQWARFLAANIPGFFVNRGVFEGLVTVSGTIHAHPEIAAAAGAVAGMALNFTAARKMVFRTPPP